MGKSVINHEMRCPSWWVWVCFVLLLAFCRREMNIINTTDLSTAGLRTYSRTIEQSGLEELLNLVHFQSLPWAGTLPYSSMPWIIKYHPSFSPLFFVTVTYLPSLDITSLPRKVKPRRNPDFHPK